MTRGRKKEPHRQCEGNDVSRLFHGHDSGALSRIRHEKFVRGYFANNSASLLESVTGALQVKFSHT